MQKLPTIARIDAALVAIVTAIVASPAFAALPFDMPFTSGSLPMRDWILMGSLALLAIALALRLMRHRGRDEPLTDAHDLRWWRNSGE